MRTLRFLGGRPLAVAGLVFIVTLGLVALLAPALAPHDPLEMNVAQRLRPPTATNWLGTDEFGRDILSRILYGARISFSVGFVSAAIGLLLGVPMGLLAGYYR